MRLWQKWAGLLSVAAGVALSSGAGCGGAVTSLAEEKAGSAEIGLAEGKLQLTAPKTWVRKQPKTRIVEHEFAVPVAEGARAKSSLLLVLADRPGVLGEILQELARRGLNLTKLESRPIPGNPWSYRFYLDVDGHSSATAFQEALAALAGLTTELRLLGTYPTCPSTE